MLPRLSCLPPSACCLLLAVGGCAASTPRILPSPLSYDEQKSAVLDIVPIGTPRGEAVSRLTEAGIRGAFGMSDSIYYCDVWERKRGQRWQLDVALLFDGKGQLYEARPANARVTVESTDAATNGGAVETAAPSGRTMTPTPRPAPPPTLQENATPDEIGFRTPEQIERAADQPPVAAGRSVGGRNVPGAGTRRTGRRTPFAEEGAFE